MSVSQRQILEIVLLSTGFILLIIAFLVSFVVLHRKRRNEHIYEKAQMDSQFKQQLLQSQIEVQELTFQQISKDLHDNVGQLLSTSKMLLGIAEINLGDKAPDTLHTAHATLGDAIQELRNLSKSLDREWIQQFSFHHNLEQLVARINAGKRITVSYEAITQPNLPHDQQIVLFRIVQEAIQNAIRHANPSQVTIRSEEQDGALHISIADNGRGLAQANKPIGMGISNMQYRTNLLGGTIRWTTQPDGSGTVVQLHLPLNPTTA